MWDVVAGPFLAAAGLLVLAGVPKVVDPLPLVRALRTAGLPVHRQLVRGFAAGEVLVGVWALVAPGRYAAGLVAAAYLLIEQRGLFPRGSTGRSAMMQGHFWAGLLVFAFAAWRIALSRRHGAPPIAPA